MKKYVLIVSEKFPKTHQRSGENTNFIAQIKDGVKKHTIRGNYDLWRKRIDEIQAGKAYLSIRIWTGKPYYSKQKEILQLTEVGIQKIKSIDTELGYLFYIGKEGNVLPVVEKQVSVNDGLSLYDFREWFKKAEYPMAIIHFTDFRY